MTTRNTLRKFGIPVCFHFIPSLQSYDILDMKIAILCSNFLFRVSGIGMDINAVMTNREKQPLIKQYKEIRKHFLLERNNFHPIATCKEIESIMSGWISFRPYTWMEEEERDGVFYPKIAVKSNKKQTLQL